MLVIQIIGEYCASLGQLHKCRVILDVLHRFKRSWHMLNTDDAQLSDAARCSGRPPQWQNSGLAEGRFALTFPSLPIDLSNALASAGFYCAHLQQGQVWCLATRLCLPHSTRVDHLHQGIIWVQYSYSCLLSLRYELANHN